MTSNTKIHAIPTGNFKLDGGAMFGVVPKNIWQKLILPDENNLCNWAMRCVLVETADRRILIDTGIGNKQNEKFYSYYHLNGDNSLEKSIGRVGFGFEDITDVLLTHLHFDHCGGAVFRNDNLALVPRFPNALYHVTSQHWEHANHPNEREKASFLPENFEPLMKAGKINFVKDGDTIADCIDIKVFNGHTFGMIVPLIHSNDQKYMFMADLIPSSAHVSINYVMGYDIQPLITMAEKKALLPWLEKNGVFLIYEHDLQCLGSRVEGNEKGQFKAVDFFNTLS
ncbi:MAG: MBL fold metallo-hydrolase [Flavobacteriales bacterium]|nr:MAG: MBL fold metallo-hydrolase [Flavobacteriales bacterium]